MTLEAQVRNGMWVRVQAIVRLGTISPHSKVPRSRIASLVITSEAERICIRLSGSPAALGEKQQVDEREIPDCHTEAGHNAFVTVHKAIDHRRSNHNMLWRLRHTPFISSQIAIQHETPATSTFRNTYRS